MVKSKQSASVTVEELVAEVTPFARCESQLCMNDLNCLANVPDSVKSELLSRIQKFIIDKVDA